MSKREIITRTLLFLMLILFVIYGLMSLTSSPRPETPELQRGQADLSSFDFDTKLAILPEGDFVYYPYALYIPEDFAQGNPPAEASSEGSSTMEWENYGTYRMMLNLPAGTTYGVSAYSAMYSQRLFINGEELSVVGIPGTTSDTTIPNTGHYTVFFTPQTNQTEILIQVANFHHSDGGGLLDLALGTAKNISLRDEAAQMRLHLLMGLIATAFLLV
jgi:hypothetical protein